MLELQITHPHCYNTTTITQR